MTPEIAQRLQAGIALPGWRMPPVDLPSYIKDHSGDWDHFDPHEAAFTSLLRDGQPFLPDPECPLWGGWAYSLFGRFVSTDYNNDSGTTCVLWMADDDSLPVVDGEGPTLFLACLAVAEKRGRWGAA